MKTKTNERVMHICAQIEAELGPKELSRLLRAVGIDPAKRETADFAPMQEATLLREACRAADDPAMAARMGITFRRASTLTAYIVRSSATLRDAIKNGTRSYGLADRSTTFALRDTADGSVLEVVTPDGALLRHHRFQEFRVFGLLARLRDIAGVDFYPQEICLRHQPGSGSKAYEKVAGCRVQFAADFNGMRFAKGALDRPLPGHDPGLVAYLCELAEEHVRKSGRGDQSTRAQVEALIIKALPGRVLSADDVGAEMGMSRRTLTRHLRQEKTSFREVLEQVRFDLAKTYLKDGLSITDTAYLLGYGDHAAFSTAFRRWSGQSPRAYRNQLA